LQREECKDHVSLYDTKSWSEVGHVTCGTNDAAGLAWSPNGSYLAVWDGCLSYKWGRGWRSCLLVPCAVWGVLCGAAPPAAWGGRALRTRHGSCMLTLCLLTRRTHAHLLRVQARTKVRMGRCTCRVQVFNADGAHATTFTAPDYSKDALGVKDVAWNASGELLAVGSFDEVGGHGLLLQASCWQWAALTWWGGMVCGSTAALCQRGKQGPCAQGPGPTTCFCFWP